MSLATQNWRYVGAAAFGAGTVASALDALYALGTAATYADGSGRTEGTGSAWNFTNLRYQNGGVTEALYPTPPTNTLGMKYLICGQASGGTKTPTMLSPDTSSTVMILAGLTKNAGNYNAWDNVNPFTSGQNSGLWRVWPGSAGSGTVYLYECQESMIALFTTVGGAVYALLLGAFCDPESSDVILDAESDGKLYGMVVSGSANSVATDFWTNNGNNSWLIHGGTNGYQHCGVFTPGSAVFLSAERLLKPHTGVTTSGLKTRSGRWGRADLGLRCAAGFPNDQLLGRLREIFVFTDTQTPSKQTNAGTTIGYCVSASTSSTADAMLLLH